MAIDYIPVPENKNSKIDYIEAPQHKHTIDEAAYNHANSISSGHTPDILAPDILDSISHGLSNSFLKIGNGLLDIPIALSNAAMYAAGSKKRVGYDPIPLYDTSNDAAGKISEFGGDIAAFLGGGEIADAVRGAGEVLPYVGKGLAALGGTGVSGVTRRVAGGALGGALIDQGNRGTGAAFGAALSPAYDAVGLAAGASLAGAGRFIRKSGSKTLKAARRLFKNPNAKNLSAADLVGNKTVQSLRNQMKSGIVNRAIPDMHQALHDLHTEAQVIPRMYLPDKVSPDNVPEELQKRVINEYDTHMANNDRLYENAEKTANKDGLEFQLPNMREKAGYFLKSIKDSSKKNLLNDLDEHSSILNELSKVPIKKTDETSSVLFIPRQDLMSKIAENKSFSKKREMESLLNDEKTFHQESDKMPIPLNYVNVRNNIASLQSHLNQAKKEGNVRVAGMFESLKEAAKEDLRNEIPASSQAGKILNEANLHHVQKIVPFRTEKFIQRLQNVDDTGVDSKLATKLSNPANKALFDILSPDTKRLVKFRLMQAHGNKGIDVDPDLRKYNPSFNYDPSRIVSFWRKIKNDKPRIDNLFPKHEQRAFQRLESLHDANTSNMEALNPRQTGIQNAPILRSMAQIGAGAGLGYNLGGYHGALIGGGAALGFPRALNKALTSNQIKKLAVGLMRTKDIKLPKTQKTLDLLRGITTTQAGSQ